jgi:hypothetical protein
MFLMARSKIAIRGEWDSQSGELVPFDSNGCHVTLKKIQGNRLQKTRGVLSRGRSLNKGKE